MNNLTLVLVGGIGVYLLYTNMHKEYNVATVTENNVDITKPKSNPVKENVPILPVERPIIKPIAVPDLSQGFINKTFNPTFGWINWDLMQKLGAKTSHDYKTFNLRTNSFM